MSRKIKEKTKQLASREKEIKKKLLGSSRSPKSKAKRIGKTALAGGIAALILYVLYKAFFKSEGKSKKNKSVGRSASGVVTEKLMTFLLPYLGDFLDNFLTKKSVGIKKEEILEKED